MILREIKNIFIKNRLTEGVDFVRKEWLKGDNTASIEWSANLWINQLHTVIGKDKKTYIYSKDWSNNTKNLVLKQEGTQLTVIFRSGTDAWSHIADYAQFTSMPDIVDFKFFINNSKAYCERNAELFRGSNMQSYWNDNVGFNIYGGKMKLLEEYDSTNDNLISSLVPCQLLKSIPASLDANNKARAAGECGMYDSISGKFYGNVASSGTFTVEGDVEPETHTGLQQIYQNRLIEGVDYETYDWLKGDGSAYIKGIKYNLWTNKVELKIGKINVTTIQNNELVYTNSSGSSWAVQQNPTLTPQLIINFREQGVGVHIVEYASMPSQLSLSFYQKEGYAYCLHGDTETKGSMLNQSRWDVDLIPTIFSYKMSYIRETLPNGSYRSNLIPCTLLHSIPRNLDAQCKERVVGECGMIDLISGKFYGNVASSGTFTVENDNNE